MQTNNRLLALVPLALLMLVLVLVRTDIGAQDAKVEATTKPKFRTESVRGRVIWLGEGLEKHFDISTVKESHQRSLAILTEQGDLLPLVEDLRGRSFRTDERLRDKPMELFVRRYEKLPMLQVLGIYELMDGKKYEVDYWCDVCSIVMFEKGFCDCCQDLNRLRHRLVEESRNDKSPKRK